MFNKKTTDMLELWLKENKDKYPTIDILKAYFKEKFELTEEEADYQLQNLGYKEV
jgi:hypothetical protein